VGAWAVDAFGNDDAGDWLYSLYESEDLSVIDSTLTKVLETEDYLEAPEASEGIAAAEVIARLQGRPDPVSTEDEELDAWLAAVKTKPDAALAKKAHAVIDRILSPPSELRELWEESEEFDAWKASIENLKARISA
jgi:hypothetical protein